MLSVKQKIMAHNVHRLAQVTAGICILLAVVGLLYRATLYWKMPLLPGDPYGISDVIEVFWFMALLVLAGLTLMFSAAIAFVPQLRNARLAFVLFLAAILAPVGYYFIHPFVPRVVG